MGSSLKTYTVEELVKLGVLEKPLDGNHGGIHPKSSEFVAEGIPFIMASDMKNGKVDTKNCKFISEDQARGLRKGFAKEGDVLLSHKATIGRTAIVDNIDTDFIVLTPQVTYYRVKDLGVINPKYLKYYFDSVKFQSLFEQWAGGGSTRLYLGITGQMKLPIELPDIETQNSIASIISDYDLKLLLNQQTNHTLEQMAQALFKSWFVDFDPVFDNLLASVDFKLENLETSLPDELKQKAQRRLAALNSLENAAEIKASLSALAHELQALSPTKEATQSVVQVSGKAAETPVKANFNANPTILAQHANTHAHFPNEFEHNEQLGWIPKGWEVKELSQLVKHQKGFPFKSAWYQDEGHIVVRVSDTTDASINVNSCNKIPEELAVQYSSYALKENDLIIATVGSWPPNYSSVVGKVIRVPTTAEGGLLNQNAVKLTVSTEYSFHQGFLHFSLKNPRFMNYIINRAQGSANQASITLKSIFAFPILIASDDIMRRFSNQVKFNFDKQNLNDEEIQSLTRLRDTLLPKLISGELQIPDVATHEEVID